jgi:hypothetical protein
VLRYDSVSFALLDAAEHDSRSLSDHCIAAGNTLGRHESSTLAASISRINSHF